MVGYTTKGEIRGECGHTHRSLQAALRCKEADQRGCRMQGGYSDRYVYGVDEQGRLTDEETPNYLEELICASRGRVRQEKERIMNDQDGACMRCGGTGVLVSGSRLTYDERPCEVCRGTGHASEEVGACH